MGGPRAQPGQQPLEAPGQPVAAVVLHGQPAVEQVEGGLAEGVQPQEPGGAQRQQQLRQHLGGAGVLGGQRDGDGVVSVVVQVDVEEQPSEPGEPHPTPSVQEEPRHHPQYSRNLNTTLSTVGTQTPPSLQ